MAWTEQQRRAIAEEGNRIVSAGAGAGKTAVLTERIVSRIAGGTPVNRMLLLTFTKAAAAEMKARILGKLQSAGEREADPEKAAYLRTQEKLLGGAYISTIHAFCMRVLKRHAHTIGLPPNPRVLDDMEAAAMGERVKDRLLTALSGEENPDWLRLLSAFGSEDAAWEAVEKTFRFLESQPDPEGWLSRALNRYETESGRDALLMEALSDAKEELRLGVEAVSAARDGLTPEWGTVISLLDDELMRCRALWMQPDYDSYRQGLFAMEFARLTFPRGTPEEEKAPVQEPRNIGKAIIKDQQKRFSRPGEEEREALRDSGVVLSALSRVVTAFTGEFEGEKREKGVVDFSDLEHLALRLLQNPEIAGEYREKFRYIAVDEYQDSNRVQEAILDCLRREDNLFLVGDVKQSIYRFRQAEPGLFLQKLAAFSGGKAGERIDLTANFRSGERVLTAVNDTFLAIMSRDMGEMDYGEREMLLPGRALSPGGAELLIIERENPEGDGEDLLDAEAEARVIAGRILELIEKEPYEDPDTGKTRKLTYGDFAVLLRSTTYGELTAQTLSQCGIPCYAEIHGGYFDAVEVQVLLNLLRVIDNRRRDVPLLSVMRSCVGDFTPTELMAVRAGRREGTYFDAVLRASELGTPLGEKLRAFLGRIDDWQRESRLISVEALLCRLLDETGFYEEVGAMEGGAQRQANLNALIGKARIFEASGARGVWSFLKEIALAQKTASIGAAQTAGANVVRILTIHKSKGLEFPMVFLSRMGAPFNLSGGAESLQLHGALGMGLRYLDPVSRVRRDTVLRQTIGRRRRAEEQSEEMRLLYVAMTRAKNRLIMVGCAKNAAALKERFLPHPAPLLVKKCNTPLNWALMGRRSVLSVSVLSRGGLYGLTGETEPTQKLGKADPMVLSAIESRFAWKYEHAASLSLPAKASVSSILGERSPVPTFRPPAFLTGKTRDGAFRGTAAHTALQHLPLALRPEAFDAGAYLASLAERGLLTPEQREAVDADSIAWFVQTPLFARMQASARVERELAVACPFDAASLLDTEAHEQVLLQGVLDCCFLEEAGWVLMDYKTDFLLPHEDPSAAAEKHVPQLRLYADALRRLTGLPVTERYVVLLTPRRIIAV